MMRAAAHAKVNFGLEVGTTRPDGFHELRGLFQSISWADIVELDDAPEDRVETFGGGEVIDGTDNLAWRAVTAVRALARTPASVRLRLDKRIPVAAGLGGGSADAAAALVLAARRFGVERGALDAVALELGSDVPFCLRGGLARVGGRGEVIHPLPGIAGFALALVVPPVELSTGRVFRVWDELGGPRQAPPAPHHLPPALRSDPPPGNDLYPAAVALAPRLEDWRAELAAAWGRPVHMSGSGPALYGFFLDREEADAALGASPPGARATHAAEPVDTGWVIDDEIGDGEGD